MLKCEFCQKDFAFKGTLSTHQKTAKYCLEIQGKECKLFECNFCLKNFTTQQNLNDHISVCKEKEKSHYQTKIKDLEEKLQKLEEKLEKQKNEYEEKLEKEREVLRQIVMKPAANIRTDFTVDDIYHVDIIEDKSEEESDSGFPTSRLEEVKRPTDLVLNRVTVCSREDGYVNAAQICQAGNKKFKDWYNLDSTKELIKVLEADTGIPASGLVDRIKGGNEKKRGSWIHPDLAIQLAQWINPTFALHVSKWIRTLFNDGSVKVDLKTIKDKNLEIRIKDHRIKLLEDKCLSKQKRIDYPERNVVYLLTTEDHLERRTYILGKAKNLTSRLGTYNKTCDHQVVFYAACKNEEHMGLAETLVMSKLEEYREKANRERFILPDDKEVSFFISKIKEIVSFVSGS